MTGIEEKTKTAACHLTLGETDYAYDTAGRMTNRLVSVTDYDDYADYTGEDPSQVVEYTYNHQNQLIGRAFDADGDGDVETMSVYIYSPLPLGEGQGEGQGQIVLHYEETAAAVTGPLSDTDLAHRYLWGPTVDELLADETTSGTGGADQTLGTPDDVAWALGDHQNSVRDLVVYDDNGTPTNLADDSVSVVRHVVYDAFGNVTDTTGTAESLFLYTGRLFDEDTGLQNNLNRWYDPSTGRWMSTDPIGFAAKDANLYRYCGNAAAFATDPTGLADFDVEPEYNRAKESVWLQKIMGVPEHQRYNDWGQPYYLASGSILSNQSGAATRVVIKGPGNSGYSCNTINGILGPDGGTFQVTIHPVRNTMMPLGGYWKALILVECKLKVKGTIYQGGHIGIETKFTGPGLLRESNLVEENPNPVNVFSGGIRISPTCSPPKKVDHSEHDAKAYWIRWAAGNNSPHLPQATATIRWAPTIGVKCSDGYAEAEGRIRVLTVRFINAPLPKPPTPPSNGTDETKAGK